MRRLRAIPLLLCAVGSFACAGAGFDYASLPPSPIVFVYRTTQEAENVDDLLKQRRKDRYKSYLDEKVRLEDVGRFLNLTDTDEDRAMSLLGRVALLHPVSLTREPVTFARRGARPLDWSPDRRRLMFAQLDGRASQLYEWDRDTGDVRPLTWGTDHVDGCYGPDGAIAMARVEHRVSRIYVEYPHEEPRAVTPGPWDSEPTWSPDGKTLIYRTFENRRAVLRSVDPTVPGSESRFLAAGQSAVFTSDGSWVVYVSSTRKGSKLFKMRADGSGRRRLGNETGKELDPTVSPDSQFVAFVIEDNDRRSLHVRTIDGTGQLPLELDGDGLIPVW